MTDPVSVAGTAVGIASLGIQACQGISQYYAQFRSFSDDVDVVLKQAEILEESLEALETIRRRIGVRDIVTMKQLQDAIEACASGLMSLKAMAARCGETKLPASPEDKRRLLKKRLLWPFRQGTLTKLKETLSSLQANVQLTVQIVNIDTSHRQSKEVHSNTIALIDCNIRIEHRLNEHTHALQSLQNSLRTLDHGQAYESARLQMMSLQLASVEKRLERQANEANIERIEDINAEPIVLFQNSSTIKRHYLQCKCRSIEKVLWWKRIGSQLEIDALRETQHVPTCILFRSSESTYRIRGRFTYCTKFFGFCVQVGMAYTNASGWTTMCPTLRLRKLVRDDSPAFAPFLNARAKLQYVVSLLRDVTTNITHSIQDGQASPYDVLSDESTILHEAYKLVLRLLQLRYIDAHLACSFLGTFVAKRLCIQKVDDLTSSLISLSLLSSGSVYKDNEVLNNILLTSAYLIRAFGSWTLSVRSPCPGAHELLYRLLSHEDIYGEYAYRCPLTLAIQQRSDRDLLRQLAAHEDVNLGGHDGGNNITCCHNLSDIIFNTVHWPYGLKVVLESKLFEVRFDQYTWNLAHHSLLSTNVQLAMRAGNLESIISIEALLQAGFVVFPEAWFSACEYLPSFRAEFLNPLADMAYGCKRFFVDSKSRSRRELIVTNVENLYRTPYLSLEASEALWNAGFTRIDEPSDVRLAWYSGDRSWAGGTPLWIQSTRIFAIAGSSTRFKWETRKRIQWDLLEWLVNKGALLQWTQPTFGTTPAHMIGLSFGHDILCFKHDGYDLHEDSEVRFLAKVLSLEHLDHCFCYCSGGPCRAIGCAVKSIGQKDSLLNIHFSTRQRYVLELVAKVIDSKSPQSTLLGLMLIRVLTFGELRLTHTCCLRVAQSFESPLANAPNFYWPPPSAEETEKETRNIHYIESKDIQILESLMDEFEQTLTEHAGTFMDYLQDKWKPRMRAACGPTSSVDPGHIQGIKEVGLVLWEPFGPQEVRLQEVSDDDSDD